MLSEPSTLYKLMILYMLKHVRFPLTHAQIFDFFLGKEYCTYFSLEQAAKELQDSHLVKAETIRNAVRYQITREGEEVLTYFGDSLSEEIRRDMDSFLEENKIRIKDEVGSTADFSETSEGEYMVQCEIREGRSLLVSLTLAVPSKSQAETMCANWQKASQEIYAHAMETLLKG